MRHDGIGISYKGNGVIGRLLQSAVLAQENQCSLNLGSVTYSNLSEPQFSYI